MLATLLQIAALVGFPIGGGMSFGWGGVVLGSAVSLLIVGDAIESNRPSG